MANVIYTSIASTFGNVCPVSNTMYSEAVHTSIFEVGEVKVKVNRTITEYDDGVVENIVSVIPEVSIPGIPGTLHGTADDSAIKVALLTLAL